MPWAMRLLTALSYLAMSQLSFSADYRPNNNSLTSKICIERSNSKKLAFLREPGFQLGFYFSNGQYLSLAGEASACVFVEPGEYTFEISVPTSTFTTKYRDTLGKFNIKTAQGGVYVLDVKPVGNSDKYEWDIRWRSRDETKPFSQKHAGNSALMCFEQLLAKDINEVDYDETLNGLGAGLEIYRNPGDFPRKRGVREYVGGLGLKGGQAACLHVLPGSYISLIRAPLRNDEDKVKVERSVIDLIEVLEKLNRHDTVVLNVLPQYIDRYRLLWLTESYKH